MPYDQQFFDFDGPPSGGRLEREFLEFHRRHPEVYVVLCKLARAWMRKGHTRLGIAMLYEVCRWEFGMGDKGDVFQLNNNHKAFYARLIMRNERDLDGLFELRVQRSRVGADDDDDDGDDYDDEE